VKGRLLDEGLARELVTGRTERARQAEEYAAKLRAASTFADRIDWTYRLFDETLGPPHRRGYRLPSDAAVAGILAELDFNARVATALRLQAERRQP
jgi:hypothetical protein